MDFLSTVFTVLASGIYHLDSPSSWPWEILISNGLDFVTNYGWRILVFAVLLKVILAPFDVYSRYKMRKNARITAELKDKLLILKRTCGSDRMLYMQKESQLKKSEGYSMFGSCLAMILTLVMSFWVWGSVRSISNYNTMQEYLNWYGVYEQTFDANGGYADQENATKAAQQAVLEYYKDNSTESKFLWIKSLWASDTPWDTPISSSKQIESRAGDYWKKNKIKVYDKNGNLVDIDNELFKQIQNSYDTVTLMLREDKSINSTNGLLILIIISAGAMALSQFLMQRLQRSSGMMGQQQTGNQFVDGMQNQMKIMIWIMPVVMMFFMLFQPAAFTLYMGIGSLTTLAISSSSTLVMRFLEQNKEESKTRKVQKYGRPDPQNLKKESEIKEIKFDEKDDD